MGVLEAILDVFTNVGTWIAGAFTTLEPVFWTAGVEGTSGSLTFMGVLAVASLAMSVAFLILGIVTRFLRFGGN